MNPHFPHLFSEITIGDCVIPNRIVSTGHHTYLSDSVPDQRLIAYHRARARGGAGLIVSEIVASHASAGFSSNLLQAANADVIPAYQALINACRPYGTRMFAQLFHPGREILSFQIGMSPIAWAPSAVPNERFHIMPKVMPVELIEEIVEGHGIAAANLAEAGFDGFEIVASHGYLPAQFLNPRTNLRQDSYGGDNQRRLKFLMDVIDSIRYFAPNKIVGLRISSSELDDDGLNLEEVSTICQTVSAQVDYFSVVQGTSASLGSSVHIVPPMGVPHGYVAHHSKAIVKVTEKPVIVTGRINQPQIAEKIIADGDAHMCGMTRAMICDAEMSNKAKSGHSDNIRACISCNQSCIGRAHKGLPISCIQHPESGRETEFKNPPRPSTMQSILVVGGGPAGMKAAAVAATRGHRVTLCEQQSQLGGQANLAMKLPGREEFGGIVDNLQREMQTAGVEMLTNTCITLQRIQQHNPDQIILATGATPLIPSVSGIEHENVVTAWDILNGTAKVGTRVAIADWRSDWIGLGLAEKLATEGSIVNLYTNSALAGETLQIYTRNHYVGRVKKSGAGIITHARLYGFDGDTAYFQDTLTSEPVIAENVDTLVLALGHHSHNTLEDKLKQSNMNFQNIGDCVVPRTAEEAVFEGLQVAWHI